MQASLLGSGEAETSVQSSSDLSPNATIATVHSISWRQTSLPTGSTRKTKLGPVSAPTWSQCLTDFIPSVPPTPGVVCGQWHNDDRRLLICHSADREAAQGVAREGDASLEKKNGTLGVPSVPAHQAIRQPRMGTRSGEISIVVIVPVPSPVAIVGAIIMAVAIVVGEIVGAMIAARPPHVAVGIRSTHSTRRRVHRARNTNPDDCCCTGHWFAVPSIRGGDNRYDIRSGRSIRSHSHVRKRSRSTPPGSRRRQKLTPTLVFASNCSCHRQRVRDTSELPVRICRSRRGQHTGSSASKKAYLHRFPFGMTNLGHL